MVVPLGMRNFLGVWKSSVRYQPPMLAAVLEKLRSSMVSKGGAGSLWVKASLITTWGKLGAVLSLWPGVPLSTPLGRHWALVPQALPGAPSSTTTSEKPKPSVIGYQL